MNTNHSYKQSLKWPWYKDIAFGLLLLGLLAVYAAHELYNKVRRTEE